MNCITTTHYATHISAECAPGGSAECDGTCATHRGTECSCFCHGCWSGGDVPDTISAMRDWHDKENAVVASYDRGEERERFDEALRTARVLKVAASDGATFKVIADRNRTCIVKGF